VNAFSGLGRGHGDVDDCYVGTVIFDGPYERWRIAGLCDDFDACLLEEFRECLADQGRVVGQDQAQRHGASIGLEPFCGSSRVLHGCCPLPGEMVAGQSHIPGLAGRWPLLAGTERPRHGADRG
jgi:hypothetical protein